MLSSVLGASGLSQGGQPTNLGVVNPYMPDQKSSNVPWKIVDEFNSTYWSGQNVRVFANDIRLPETTQVSYQIIEQVKPHYGYASYVPDKMVQGQRLVVGEITMNFKREGYLLSLLAELAKDSWVQADPKQNNTGVALSLTQYGLVSEQAKADIKAGKYKGDSLSAIVASLKEKENASLNTPESSIDVAGAGPVFYTKPSGFDLSVVTGGDIRNYRTLRFNGVDSISGSITKNSDNSNSNNLGSGIRLISVYIGSSSKSINDDGRPIMETLSFQAKTIQLLSLAEID